MSNKLKSQFFSLPSLFVFGAVIVTVLWYNELFPFVPITPTPSATNFLPINTPNPTITSTFTLAPTPTLPDILFHGVVTQPTYCHNGPNKSYLGAIALPAGTN